MEEFFKYKDEVVSLRRDFHMYPELGFEERRTSEKVRKYLENLGIKTRKMAKTGVVGYLDNGGDKTIAIRADMDALPIQEENDVPYASKIPGKMHACGHDAHTAMLLVSAKILSQMKFDGNIRFIFQPAEEGFNGARKMIEEGALEDVDYIFGLHVWANLPTGVMAITPGPVLANVDSFKISIRGVGGHGASPHQTKDPIVATAQIISSLQSIVARNVDPMKMAVVTVGKIVGGTAFNIIPEEVRMEGTVRTYDDDIHTMVERRLKEITKNIARAYGCKARITYRHMNYATVNDETLTKIGKKIASEFMEVVDDLRDMGGEDFSEYARRVPGLFAFLGVRNEEKGIIHPHHSPRFDIDDDALIYGVAFEVKMALKLLEI
jgi:amidohydrolase